MDEQTRAYAMQCAEEDAEAAILHFEELTGVAHDTLYVDDIVYRDGADGLQVTMTYAIDHENSSNPNDAYVTEVEVGYWVEGDELECSHSPEDIANELIEAFTSEGAINASTSITAATPITAADEDEEAPSRSSFMNDDMFAEDVESDDISEQIDDLSDTVDDLQDSVDEVEEDDTQIEVNNNIEHHYIAECESCQGIFISSVIKSDQYIDKISGVCPLCNKETDQYLKWVVSPIE